MNEPIKPKYEDKLPFLLEREYGISAPIRYHLDPKFKELFKKWEKETGKTARIDNIDKGGLTNLGITFATWKQKKLIHLGEVTEVGLIQMNKDQWARIVKSYHDSSTFNGHVASSPVCMFLSDFSWSGLGLKQAQRAINTAAKILKIDTLMLDGVVGKHTVAVCNEISAMDDINVDYDTKFIINGGNASVRIHNTDGEHLLINILHDFAIGGYNASADAETYQEGWHNRAKALWNYVQTFMRNKKTTDGQIS